ncbi:uncharacterized protein PAF06_007690 [Gastrophryne carolinensis]
MTTVYRISASDKTQALENELASQLSELKAEIEANGVLDGTPGRAYSTVPIPKDIIYYRNEREMILKRSLQVASAKPVTVQADVMQRELESCLGREYSEDNLPLLLHQFFTDRIHYLAQCKYLHMLRWKRFCRHTSAMEACYPYYQEQLGYIMQEYSDAVQRAQRLAIARENLLTGQKNSIHLVTLEDLVIYLQWLICHLHTVKPIYNYIRILQYLPISDLAETVVESHYKNKECQNSSFESTINQEDRELTDDEYLPQHQTETQQIKPLLQDLLSNFKMNYDLGKLKDTANEMELLSLVVSQFRSTFRKQQTMRTFPMYDSGMEPNDGWGFRGPNMAFKKPANWLPFVKIKPKRDPWQQKFLAKLKQHKKVDELLNLQSQFTEVTDAEKAMEVLQQHAARVIQPIPLRTVSTKNSYGIWVKMYTPLDQTQDLNDGLPLQQSSENSIDTEYSNKRPMSSRQRKETGYNYQNALQLLGLDEAEDTSKDPIMMKGAYLSFLYLRHLRVRELQRICLGFLNYFRSIERTLTIDTSGLTNNSGDLECCAREDANWINAAQGGLGVPGGLGSHHYMHRTPADYKVHSGQFMEFSEVENHNDFYKIEDGIIHTQDQRGAYIIYDVALDDLKELQNQLLLHTTLLIERERLFKTSEREASEEEASDWAHINVDRFALLLDLWTWECSLLENKQQLVDIYYEAYQHVFDPEERFALAQVITDIMYHRPRFDIGSKFFLEAYREECQCLRLHLQLARNILNNQIESQREYVKKVWRDGRKGGFSDFGLPLNIVTKTLVSLSTSSSALKNVYLLEFHPSLGLSYLIHNTLKQIAEEFQYMCKAKTPKEAYNVEIKVLELALAKWSTPEDLWSSITANVCKDLLEEVLIEDPLMVKDICMAALNSADEEHKHGRAKQKLILEIFSKILELITLRHRIIEATLDTVLLSRTYTYFAEEMGFSDFHLYLRPVQFEFATHKTQVDHTPPMFITSLLEDDSSVDRYCPSAHILAIHEVDDSQIGKFSFWTKEGLLQLLTKSGVENMQMVLASQVIQKNVLLAATQLASLCHLSYWSDIQALDRKDGSSTIQRRMSSVSERTSSSRTMVESQRSLTPLPHPNDSQTHTYWTKKRIPEAFVSIQLEKVGPRDAMLNAFLQKKQVMGPIMRNPEEVEKIKRELVTDYCQKLSRRISTHSLRGQILTYCHSLKQLLEDFSHIKKTYFVIGNPQEKQTPVREAPKADLRTFQERPRAMLTEDGKAFVNLWYIPYTAEVLSMFKMLPEKAAHRALYYTLQIMAALHDIISCILSFAQLGNSCGGFGSVRNKELSADWGGIEGIGAELRDLQNLIDSLQDPQDPQEVAALLLLRREVMILQFDAAVRHSIRDAFLSTGNISAFKMTTDNIYHGLTALSDSVVRSAFSSLLPVPRPLDPRSHRTVMLYPWRTFLADGGLFPLVIYGIHTIGHHIQLCLCDMTDQERSVAHGELVGVHLLMEDILQGNYDFISFTVGGNLDAKQISSERFPAGDEYPVRKASNTELLQQDPFFEYTLLRSFLILWKQLELFKDKWGKMKLRVEEINTVCRYRQFCELYRDEIFYPTMKMIAQNMGKEEEYEGLAMRSQVVLPPKEASEIDIRIQQLQKIMESFECDMMHNVQKRIAKEMTLLVSERTREGIEVPTELWMKPVMKANFSPARPQIVENFVQQLMSNNKDSSTEVTFRKEHLEHCLTTLACDIMMRERSNFEAYSMFYENLLQQEHQLLYQKEQELLAVAGEQRIMKNGLSETADMSHDLLVEITALRAKLHNVEEEAIAVKEAVRKQVQDEYESLVRSLFTACVSLKSGIDGHQINIKEKVTDVISEVRKESVDEINLLRKTIGTTGNETDNTSMEDQLQFLQDENYQLQALICKIQALNKWKIRTKEGKLQEKLKNAEKEAVQNKKERLNMKMKAEQEVALLRQELMVARTALSRTQADANKLKQQLIKQKQLLNECEHRYSEEKRSRQQLDSLKTASIDKLLEDNKEKQHRLHSLAEEAERSSKLNELQQNKVQKEIKQIKSQLFQERHFKIDAFQRVDELQTQVYEMEMAISQRNTPLVSSAMSTTSLSLPNEAWDILQYKLPTETRRKRRLQRPKTVPSRCRVPELSDSACQTILTRLQELRLGNK